MRTSSVITALVAGGLALGLASCATPRKAGWETALEPVALTSSEQGKLLAEVRKHWKIRHEAAELDQAIQGLEKLAAANPKHYEVLVLLCRGYFLKAEMASEGSSAQRKGWETAVAWGERALATQPQFEQKVVVGGAPLEQGLSSLKKVQVDALYWTAASLDKWAKAVSMSMALQERARVTKMMERVEQLDPDYFYGAVYRYWGEYYALAPYFAGGSLDKSQDYFRKTFKVSNMYFGSHVLYAQNYASRKEDKDLFRKELEFVLKGDPQGMPDVMPEQVIEQRKARQMLDRMKDYFNKES